MYVISSTHTIHSRQRAIIRFLLLTLSVWIVSYQSLRTFLCATNHTHTYPTQSKPFASFPITPFTTNSTTITTNNNNHYPHTTIGILTDVQYAPVPDGFSFDGVPRYYRRALNVTKLAATDFERRGVDLVVNLGDSIDGKCYQDSSNNSSSMVGRTDSVGNAGTTINEDGSGVVDDGKHDGTNCDCDDDNNDDGTSTKHQTRGTQTPTDNDDDDTPNNHHKNHKHHNHHSSMENCMNDFLTSLSPYQSGPILHTYGNHDLYNFDRETIGQKLGIPFVKEPSDDRDDDGELVGYYTHLLPLPPEMTTTTSNLNTDHHPNHNYNHHINNAVQRRIRIVVLDVYDISVLQRQRQPTSHNHHHHHHHHHPSSSKFQRATDILITHNSKNYFTNPNSSNGLTSFHRRYVAYNGAIDQPQLMWLSQTLSQARVNHEMVLVLSHVPIFPLSAEREPESLVWNYEEIMDVLRKDGRGVVAMVLQGHIHKGGYGRDDVSGIHFRGFQSVIEGKDPTYGYLEIYNDRLVVNGVGDCESGVYDLKHLEV